MTSGPQDLTEGQSLPNLILHHRGHAERFIYILSTVYRVLSNVYVYEEIFVERTADHPGWMTATKRKDRRGIAGRHGLDCGLVHKLLTAAAQMREGELSLER